MSVLPAFDSIAIHADPPARGVAIEDEWMARVAAAGSAEAHVWRATAALVVPVSYTKLPGWPAASAAPPTRGWPVQVRHSGGGLVPQGPGLLNVTLIWPSGSATPRDTDAVYIAVCDAIALALARIGVVAKMQPVEGSFCDGRFNLAANGRKLVGTAQAWRRVDRQPVTLAHAVLIFDANLELLTAVANAFEDAVSSGRRYRADSMTSVVQAWRDAHSGGQAPSDLEALLVAALAAQFTQAA